MSDDRLLHIFKKHLRDESDMEQTEDDLIYTVVVEYMLELMHEGNVPNRFMDTLENDLKEELREVYKKTTYGYQTLKDYRSLKLNKQKKRVS